MMIYLVEDDENIRELIVYMLQTSGWKAKGFACGADFWEGLKVDLPAMILLDIMLPDEDGLSILSKLKRSAITGKIPVIMLTAKGTEYDKVLGLDAGADDYVSKPFGMMELVSRIKALFRRTQIPLEKVRYQIGELFIDTQKHEVVVNGKAINLTHKEFELLCYLIQNRGLVLNREQLLTKIWGYDFDGETRTVDVHIRTLRQKLGAAGDLIETIRGVGYKIGDKE